MKIYLVSSTNKSWMNGGYGHALLAGEKSELLVSFVEFAKDPKQSLICKMDPPVYIPTNEREPKE